ncbi:MAG TPA: citrate synthase family protein [Stellaceae bacterium]|nr:citrate synthase family protein [Stellaceae bacterium]
MARESNRYLSAREAAARLKVTPATLYAYVSRGLIRSEPGAGRRRRYLAEDVETLGRRHAASRDPAAAALDWGAPVLDSAITAIAPSGPYYRGVDALALARAASVRDVAGLLWQGDAAALFAADNVPSVSPRLVAARDAAGELPPLERCLVLLPHAAAADPRAYDLSPPAVARTGARMLRLMAAIVARNVPAVRPVDALIAEPGTGAPTTRSLLRAALILCADHELNVSAFTVRCVASAGANPYLAVAAGLGALRGARHGGLTERTGVFLEAVLGARDLEAELAARLQRGESLPGFGHPLYPAGDPRARLLLALLAESGSEAERAARPVAAAVAALTGRMPTIDWALAVLGRALALPAGGALALFALGRTLGWVAHAQEQYASERIIRPRARYVGPEPGQDPSAVGVEPPPGA